MSLFQDQDPNKFSKLYIALKFRLKGMGFYDAMSVLELCKTLHDGFRKNGKTPEFQHQLEIAHFILTLKDVEDLEKAIMAALTHDSFEDYPGQFISAIETHCSLGAETKNFVVQHARILDKNRYPTYDAYFEKLSKSSYASIVKGVDRINNFQSMSRGNFSIEKQEKYASEVVKYFLPMLKTARKNFPKQMDTYYMIEYVLKSQHELISLFLENAKATSNTRAD